MLRSFNGAELFIDAIPMLAILGVSTDPPQPRLVWPVEYCIDEWLRRLGTEAGWPIARANYGSIWLLSDGLIREWDLVNGHWSGDPLHILPWSDQVIERGREYIEDTHKP